MDGIVTQTVFFTAGLVVAAFVAASLLSSVSEITAGIEFHAEDMASELRSAIRIVSDPVKVPTSPLKLLAKNTGHKTLVTAGFSVLVDGTARPDADVAKDVLDQSEDRVLAPGDVLQLTVSNLSLAAGDHDAKVVADTGVSDRLRFRVT